MKRFSLFLISDEIEKNLSGGMNIVSFGETRSDVSPFDNLKFDFNMKTI
jgi:hypothetical protein